MSEARVIPLHVDDPAHRRALDGGSPTTVDRVPPATDPDRRRPGPVGGGRWPRRSRSCAGGWRATTPSTSSGSTPTSPSNVILPALRPLYRSWFRVETIGMDHVPDVGGALVVANHSGTLPLDSLMTAVALHDDHPGAAGTCGCSAPT